jgi:hypothetical protein
MRFELTAFTLATRGDRAISPGKTGNAQSGVSQSAPSSPGDPEKAAVLRRLEALLPTLTAASLAALEAVAASMRSDDASSDA